MSSPHEAGAAGGPGPDRTNRVNLEVDSASAQVFPAIRGRQLASMGRRFCAAFVTWILVALPATAFLVGVVATLAGRDVEPLVGKVLTAGILISVATLAAEVVGLALAGTTLGGWVFRVRHVNVFTGQQGGASAVVKYLTHTLWMVVTAGLGAIADLTAIRERLQRTSVDHWFRIVALAPARDTLKAAGVQEMTDEANGAGDGIVAIDPEDPNAQLPEVPDFDQPAAAEPETDFDEPDRPASVSLGSATKNPRPGGSDGSKPTARPQLSNSTPGADSSSSQPRSSAKRPTVATVDLRDHPGSGPDRPSAQLKEEVGASREGSAPGVSSSVRSVAGGSDDPVAVAVLAAGSQEVVDTKAPHDQKTASSPDAAAPEKPEVADSGEAAEADAPQGHVETDVPGETDLPAPSVVADVEAKSSDGAVQIEPAEQSAPTVVDVSDVSQGTNNTSVDGSGTTSEEHDPTILEVVKPAGVQVLQPQNQSATDTAAQAGQAPQVRGVIHQPVNSGIVADSIAEATRAHTNASAAQESEAQADAVDAHEAKTDVKAAEIAIQDAQPAELVESAEPVAAVEPVEVADSVEAIESKTDSKGESDESLSSQTVTGSSTEQLEPPATRNGDVPHTEKIYTQTSAAPPRPAVEFTNSSPKIFPKRVDSGSSGEGSVSVKPSDSSELTSEAGTIFESDKSSPQLEKSSESSPAAEVGPSVERNDALRSVQVSPVDLRPQTPVDSQMTTNVKEEATVVVSPDELAEAAQQQDAVITLDDGTALAVPAGVTLLGRNPAVNDEFANACVHTIKDLSYSVSKTHLALGYGDTFWIMDLGSTNGTFLLDDSGALRRLPANQRVEVTQGVSIKFGERTFSVTRS